MHAARVILLREGEKRERERERERVGKRSAMKLANPT